MLNDFWPFITAGLCAFALMPVVMMRPKVSDHGHLVAPQNVHKEPTSRFGGAVVFCAYVVGVAAAYYLNQVSTRLMGMVLLCAAPVVLAGLFEDYTRHLSPLRRLFAALASAMLASAVAGGVIARFDLPYIDGWLEILVFALPLTWFMVMGACNALNLIDGFHGLAAGTALLMFAGIAFVAGHVGDRIVLIQALIMIGALAGFLCWNYPNGRVFLGDGGAYFIGFMYAQLSIQIVARNDQISAWFVIMLAAYPVMETLYSIYRRKIVDRKPLMQPDASHLHSLVFHDVIRRAALAGPVVEQDRINARVAPRLWIHGAICCAFAVGFHNNTEALIIGIAAYAILYRWHYATLGEMVTYYRHR